MHPTDTRTVPLALCLLAIAGCIAAFSTKAQSTTQTPAPQRLGLCAACHGERGMATSQSIPNLAGQNLDYLRSALIQYQSGARDVAAMRAAAAMLNAGELDQILTWYAAQKPAEPGAR
jgi:cytochrome c553